MGEQVLRRGLAVGVGFGVVGESGLLEPRLDNAVVDDCGVASRAHAEAEIVLGDQHAHFSGELARAVGDHVSRALGLAVYPRRS